ncbi:hypothetical protein O3P69_013049 [Scylla paramamosain]|uniref:Uncharacterized protein n=2 Tax=Scylla paramamosain TaxID=85552 RepID=A0AAW0TU13_SCYPA
MVEYISSRGHQQALTPQVLTTEATTLLSFSSKMRTFVVFCFLVVVAVTTTSAVPAPAPAAAAMGPPAAIDAFIPPAVKAFIPTAEEIAALNALHTTTAAPATPPKAV